MFDFCLKSDFKKKKTKAVWVDIVFPQWNEITSFKSILTLDYMYTVAFNCISCFYYLKYRTGFLECNVMPTTADGII